MVDSGDPFDHFTGRDAEVAAYDALWMPGSQTRAVAFTGISGNGKSWLLRRLAARERAGGRPVVLLDLAANGLAEGSAFLERVADDLAAAVRDLDLRRFRKDVDEAESAAAAIRRAQPVVDVDVTQTATKAGRIVASPITVQVGIGGAKARKGERLAEHWRQARPRLQRALLEAVGPRPWVLLVDSYETAGLAPSQELRDWFEHDMLAALERQGSEARVVVAGREGVPKTIRRIELAQWDRAGSDGFLEGWGLTDEDLRDAIFRHCKGHPLATDLARSTWQQGRESNQPLRPTDLRAWTNTRLAVEWLMDEFVRRLPGDLGGAVLAAAHFRHVVHDALDRVMPTGRRLDDQQYNRLVRLSFMGLAHDAAGGAYRAHDLVREVEQARRRRERSSEYRQINETALAYFTDRGDHLNTLYHGLAVAPSMWVAGWGLLIEQARQAYDHAGQEALLGLLLLPERWETLDSTTHGCHALYVGLLAVQRGAPVPAEAAFREAEGLLRELARDRSARPPATPGPTEAAFLQAEQSLRDGLDRRRSWALATALQGIGDVCAASGRGTEAASALRRAQAVYREIGDADGEANTWCALGDLHAQQGQLREGNEAYERAFAAYRKAGNRRGQAWANEGRASILLVQGRLREAETLLRDVLPIFTMADDVRAQVGVHLQLSTIERLTGRHADAEESLRQAIAKSQRIHDGVLEARSRMDLAELLLQTDRVPAAVDALEETLPVLRETRDRRSEARVHVLLGDAMSRTLDLPAAVAAYREAARIAVEIDDLIGQTNADLKIGDLYRDSGVAGVSEAEAAYERALQSARRIPSPPGEAGALVGLGMIRMHRQPEEARAAFLAALQLHEQLGEDHRGAANAHLGLAQLDSVSGNVAGADAEFAAALELFSLAADEGSVLLVRAARGKHHLSQGRFSAAATDWVASLGGSAGGPSVAHRVQSIVIGECRSRCMRGDCDADLAPLAAILRTVTAAILERERAAGQPTEMLAAVHGALIVIENVSRVHEEDEAKRRQRSAAEARSNAAVVDAAVLGAWRLVELVAARVPDR